MLIPKLSVLMSVYNGEDCLKMAIESILNQSYEDYEFIIFNDGSIDNSWDIIQQYAMNDNRIIKYNQENMGLTITLNKGIHTARGKYIARQDADDSSDKDRLKKQINWFNANKNGVLCGTWANKNNNYFKLRSYQNPTDQHNISRYLKYRNSFNHTSVVFLKKVNGYTTQYNENIKYAQDYELWSRMNKWGKIGNIGEYLVSVNERDESISKKNYSEQRAYAILVAMRNNFPELEKLFSNKLINPIDAIIRLQKLKKYQKKKNLLLFLYQLKLNYKLPEFRNILDSSRKELFNNIDIFLPSLIKNSLNLN